jgi:2-polyprenyl-3-methyl-5-hydroxy-6-metoxy-1,4-benzoquinol methylase
MNTRLKKHPLGFYEIIEKPTSEELKKYYSGKYYQESKGSYEAEYSQQELSYFKAKLEQRHEVIKQHFGQTHHQPIRMLDVGCGEGFALAYFRQQGWNVKGFDFSSSGVISQNPNCQDVLKTGDVFQLLTDEIKQGNKYDVIWLQNVLEHVLDPLALLASLRTLVADNGLAVITVPNDCSSVQTTALANGHIDEPFWVYPPDHLSYFDVKSLTATATHTGWGCIDILGDFPVDWFLYHAGSNYIRDKKQGKSAHIARVQLENLIHTHPIEDVIQFWSAAAKIGVSRCITAILKPQTSI